MTDATYHGLATSHSAAVPRNPFVPISATMRAVIITYFVIWRLVPTIAVLAGFSTTHPRYAMAIALAQFVTEILILLPFLVTRFGGTPIGWLHPLILPTVVSISFGLLRDPTALLEPFTIWFRITEAPDHQLLFGWPEIRVLEAQLKLNLINLLALACTYAGFTIVLRRSNARQQIMPIQIDGKRIALLFAAFVLIVLVFLQQQGGILAHMSTLGGGRFRMRQLSGHFLVVNAFLPYLLLLWYAYRRKAARNPLFLAALTLAVVLQFVVTGSRLGLFTPLAMALAVWIYHHKKLPGVRAGLIGLIAILVLGALGEVRRSGLRGEVDFSALTQLTIESAWVGSQEELAARNRETGLAITALVPEEQAHLYGTTYLAMLGFWVPRTIWPDKPRGSGALAAALLFRGHDTMEGYEGGGYPVSSVPEAYWNFSYPGVFLVHILYGFLLGSVARWFLRAPNNPYALMTLLMLSFVLTSPNTTHTVSFVQRITLLFFVYIMATRLRIRT